MDPPCYLAHNSFSTIFLNFTSETVGEVAVAVAGEVDVYLSSIPRCYNIALLYSSVMFLFDNLNQL